MATKQQWSTDHGIVDENDKPIVREEAPPETAAERAALDAQVGRAFETPYDRGLGQGFPAAPAPQGARKFGKPPA
jgi:hypothetical protein